MKKVLLDTNMLLAPVQFKADVYGAIAGDFCTLDKCIEELRKIAGQKTKAGLHARAAIILAKTMKVRVVKSTGKSTDKAILEAAKRSGYIVATNDKELIKELKAEGIGVIRLKQKKLLREG